MTGLGWSIFGALCVVAWGLVLLFGGFGEQP